MKRYNTIINKRFYILMSIIIFSFIMLIYELTNVQIFNNKKYKNKIDELTINTIKSSSTPRGRIYDRNYNLLVDNVGIKTIYYKRSKSTSSKDIIKTIKKVKDHVDIDYSKLTFFQKFTNCEI